MVNGPLDPQQCADLVHAHQANIRTFVRMLGVQSASVDDVAQEVFLIAFRRYGDFDPSRGTALQWLRGIARRVVANELRSTLRRQRLVRSAELADVLAESALETAPDAVHRAEIHQALAQCLERLPAHGQELLRLRYAEDLDAATLGERSGRDANAVRQTLFRLREVLRQCLGDRLGEGAWP